MWILSSAFVNSVSLPERGGDCSGGESWTGTSFAPSKSIPTASGYFVSDKTMGHSILSRFGMIFALLTEDHGKGLLMSYREGSRARTSRRPEKVLGSRDHGPAFGKRWIALSVRWNRNSCMWKTPLLSLLEDSTLFSPILPPWGMMRNGELWERTMPALGTKEIGSGFLPTPRGNDAEKRGAVSDDPRNELARFIRKYPTPTASMHRGSSEGALTRKSGKSRENDRLDFFIHALTGSVDPVNPEWVELYMGWPKGWTRLVPMAESPLPIFWDGWEDGAPRTAKKNPLTAHRLRAIGNGQCPQAFLLALNILIDEL